MKPKEIDKIEEELSRLLEVTLNWEDELNKIEE